MPALRIVLLAALGWLLACTRNAGQSSDASPPAAEPARSPPTVPLTSLASWPRMRADRFGCLMERELGARDARFNCALHGYENQGDPCQNTDAYYEGPAFPEQALPRLRPAPRELSLDWEHGDLQAISVTLPGRLSEDEARRRVGLRAPDAGLPGNVNAVSVSACREDTCVRIEGFDHMGAGEVECPE